MDKTLNWIPHSLVVAGLLFLLAGILRILDGKRPGPSSSAPLRRRTHLWMAVAGFVLIWVGMFLLVRGLH